MLDYLELYSSENPDDQMLNTTDFIGFLNMRHMPEAVKRNSVEGGNEIVSDQRMPVDGDATDVSILVTLLFRYAKMYVKKALKDSRIRTVDEFSFLITLLTHDHMSKQELINTQVMEKTSGIEVVNRLIKQGFVLQSDDKSDRRSKLIRISPEGRKEILSVLPQMGMVSRIVLGNLNKDEQRLLAYLLRKLDRFHNDIFLNDKDQELEELIRKA